MKLSEDIAGWLDTHAEALDRGTHASGDRNASDAPAELLSTLARAGLFRIGVPAARGGTGGTTTDAVLAIAATAAHSQAAGFVFWAQRVFIEYLLQSPNDVLAARWLPPLLDGTFAGATGLSNAMKYLGGIESLQTQLEPTPEGWIANGQVPWATNLVKNNFAVAVAADDNGSGRPGVYAIPHDAPGVTRSPDLDLVGLRGSSTASLRFTDARLAREYLLHDDAHDYLPRVRPAFLGMQCGLSIGLAQRSIAGARERGEAGRSILSDELDALAITLDEQTRLLSEGIESRVFETAPRGLFELRIGLVDTAIAATQLEVQARGGAGYMVGRDGGLARRWREASFLPIVTPSLVQLRTALAEARQRKVA
ncbi:acyl-CoA dehydrogenase family protein [Cupriavidus pampae]|uniref:Acyl-CoA dehydrogenase fadE25 n=1 Tax=Cupriavidus pampae TaxID=659251 RepID=A0ABM8X0I7_9BURK|nr:acyl-CoA dehydrogenase family protein [Cupriavidus pampae]CAG9173394.1 putative acyl-CoA dehydrogenase fadE25 [Cupriavidus pampae]